MGIIDIVQKLKVIDNECKHNDVLRKQLEPWVLKMNGARPTSKSEAMKISKEFIDKYNEIKKQLGDNNGQDKCVRKIEQINEG
jgi:hypothetical protein